MMSTLGTAWSAHVIAYGWRSFWQGCSWEYHMEACGSSMWHLVYNLKMLYNLQIFLVVWLKHHMGITFVYKVRLRCHLCRLKALPKLHDLVLVFMRFEDLKFWAFWDPLGSTIGSKPLWYEDLNPWFFIKTWGMLPLYGILFQGLFWCSLTP